MCIDRLVVPVDEDGYYDCWTDQEAVYGPHELAMLWRMNDALDDTEDTSIEDDT
jgi:hypothetical protein